MKFEAKINKQSGVYLNGLTTECWLWTGTINPTGYGAYQTNWAKTVLKTQWSHRISYHLFKEAFLPCENGYEKQVRHKCDNPKCVNPDHLEFGSQAENNSDRDSRGRHMVLCGETNGSSKLTPEIQEQIRELRKGGMIYKDIAARFNVNRRTVERFCTGSSYGQEKVESAIHTARNVAKPDKAEVDARIRELRANGATYAVISREVGRSQSYISILLKSNPGSE